ncbi:hypothetical protein X805_05390 [Sphaerotilus natans subsp. natans DSM 6575]|uniref:Calcium-binding protein n=3 Tax=Sphaerotilus natans TaxID=34103 RepID=A0A059KQZ5_9BURK|nr:calcium-binding protein [Sphaerotilus natans]KDB53907.1 hypothetical protein X805_05390 [Sphaerotilus natans subsp. natans DSM 6575]
MSGFKVSSLVGVVTVISGKESADTLTGGDGADEVFGYGSADSLSGGGGDDTLWGGWGNDTLLGGAGADLLVGELGDDLLDGGQDGDTYRVTGNTTTGFHGYDTYKDTGTEGTDRIVAVGTGNVDIGVRGFSATGIEEIDARGATGTVRVLDTGDANLIDLRGVTVLGTNLVIDAGSGNDTVFGSAAADLIVAANGDDVVDGAGGGDTFRVTGNTTAGFQGHDTYKDSGTEGTDRIVALGTGNVDIGLKGNFSAALLGIEVIDGSGATGTVRILGESSANLIDLRGVTITGTNVVIDGGNGNDTIFGSAGADTLVSHNGEDVVDGAGGGDTYRVTGSTTTGFHGYDTFKDSGTEGVDRIVVTGTGTGTGTGNVDIGLAGAFNAAASGIEVIDGSGATGTVRILGDSTASVIDLRGVTITGTNVVIDGGNGNDTIFGSAGADTLVSHSGEDVVDGAGGGDTFRVTGNLTTGFHGYDTFKDSGTEGADRIVALGTGNVDIGIKGFAASGIEEIDARGATGTVRLLDTGDANLIDLRGVTVLGTNLVIDAGSGNDTVFGSAAADLIVAGNGDDVLDGVVGGDTFRVTGNTTTGFQGYDTYKDTGTEGVDRIEATGSGNVDIGLKGFAASGIEVIDGSGATGTVRLLDTSAASLIDLRGVSVVGTNVVIDANFGNDTIFGSAGADTIVGAGGNDWIDGGEGGDTYRVTGNEAGGWSSFHNHDTWRDSGTSGVDRIVALGTGNVDIGMLGNFSAGLSGIEEIDARGATGTVRLYGDGSATLLDFRGVTLQGTNIVIDSNFGNDTVYGSAAADTLLASWGDDVLDGAGGGDTFRVTGNTTTGFQGHDTYADSGLEGTDRIAALGAGNVDIGLKGNFSAATSGIEVIDGSGATGTVRILGESTANVLDLRGVTITGTNVVIDGGNGNDTIFGSAAADTLVSHNGEDVVDGAGGGDTFRVTGNLTTGFHGYDTFKDSGISGIDRIVATGTGHVDIGIKGFAASGIEEIDARGATGTVRLLDTGDANLIDLRGVTVLGTNLVIDAGSGNDTVFGSAAADLIVAGNGDDVLDGAGGGDTFRVTGNTTTGFQGYDTYKDSGTEGVDRIEATSTGNVDIGVKGFAASGVEVIDGSGATGTVRLLDADTANVIDLRGVSVVGTNVVIDANFGNDTIHGSAGADTIVGAGGNDWIDGGEGGDTYRVTGNEAGGWSSFHNHDTWRDSGTSGVDRISALGTGNVDIGMLGNFSAGLSGIEEIDARGVTGTVRLYGDGSATLLDFRGVTLQGTNIVIDSNHGNDTVYGSAAADTLLASWGDDVLDGAGGGDTFRVTGNTTTGFQGHDNYADTGTEGSDRIVALGTGNVDIGLKGNFSAAASGIEVIDGSGATGTVRILGESSANLIDLRGVTITGANVVIDGGNGNDTIFGSAGADTLVSHNGEDVVDGAGGGDTYRVTGNTTTGFHGYDTFKDSGTSGTDRIVATGTGHVDIGLAGAFNAAASGIEVIDGSGATGTVRILGDSTASVLDLRGVTITGANVVIDGGNGNDTIFGSAGADTLISHSGEDVVDGAGGGDTFRVTGNLTTGFHGYDTFKDSGTEGVDRIVAQGTGNVDIGVRGFAASGIEEIDARGATGTVRLLDTGDANLIDLRGVTVLGTNLVIDGGHGNDTIFGSAGADTIVGGAADDLLDGGEGGDTFQVSGNEAGGWSGFHGYDTFKDSGAGGTDRIVALGSGSVDIGLRSWVDTGIEQIDASGAAGTVRLLGDTGHNLFDFRSTTLTGANLVIDANRGHDTVFGSAGDDTIVAGAGDDLLDGGEGGDTYRITGGVYGSTEFMGWDTWADTGLDGIDRIVAISTGSMDIGVRDLSAGGIEILDVQGVAGQARLLGTSSDDIIDLSGTTVQGSLLIDAGGGTDLVLGSSGNDTILGSGGADSLAGGAGNDVYRIGRDTGLDVIWDWDDAEGNQDVVEFGAGISAEQLWFQRLDGFVEVTVLGTWNRVYLMDWDTDPAARIEVFRTADGRTLQAAQVDTLIEAMSAFAMPSIGTTTLPADYQTALQPVISGTWSS